MTVRYHWSIQAKTPFHIASSRAFAASTQTLAYIPGTAVRGAVAAAFLARQSADTPVFHRLTEKTCYGHAYPTLTSGTGSSPLPLSSVTCRRAPGFRADGGHGVDDLLLAAEAFALAHAGEQSERMTTDGGALIACARCADDRQRQPGDAIVPWHGWYGWDAAVPRHVCVQFGTQIEGRTGGAGEQQEGLTARQTVQSGQHFACSVTFPDEETAALVGELLARQGNRLWVGAGRSRGLGEVLVDAQVVPGEAAAAESRQEGLADRLARLCSQAGARPPAEQTYISLTLQAAALVPDAFGRWQRTCNADLLSNWTGLPANALEVRQSFQDVTWLGGWNAALGLPKPDALSLAAGSCWLFRVVGEARDEVMLALQRLEDQGIGERRQEGFGVVRVCDPLHWQVQELGQELTA